MVPSMDCWDNKDLINIYGSEADINTETTDAARLTNNLFFGMDYDNHISPSLSSYTAADYLLSGAANLQYPLDIGLSSVVHAHVTTLSLCKHWLSFINCRQCKGKVHDHKTDLPVWMIYSGASLYFTYDIGDFTEYQPMMIPIPIQTVNNITYVTRLGTVIIPVLTNKGHPYTVHLYLVYHISDITSQLLLMITFLLDNLTVHSNAKSISFL